MSRRPEGMKRVAPRSTSHGKSIAEIELINELPVDVAVSNAELAAVELLVGWEWFDQLIQTCGGSEADV